MSDSGPDYREQLRLLAEVRGAYPRDFSSSTEAGLAVLAAVQGLIDDPTAATALARRWEQQFVIAEAWAEHRSDVRAVESKLSDGDVRHALQVVDEHWRQNPVQMLRKCRQMKARQVMFRQYPDRHDAYRQIFRRVARGEIDANLAEAEQARLDALWLSDEES